jgi:membrane associated rhomboid family serine protease
VEPTVDPDVDRSLQRLTVLFGLAGATLLIAVLAGLALWITNPEAESATEDTLESIWAASGLATGVLAIAAVIYAQIKGLWRVAPGWMRVVAWTFIGLVVARAVLS